MSTRISSAETRRGYLPSERPPPLSLISLGFQHVLTMFPATVLVAVITRFDVGVTLFASGLATVVAVLGSRCRIPLWYGASFSYIAPVVAIVSASGGSALGVRMAQGGILATGLMNILAGFLIQRAGKSIIERILPPIVTGSIAIVIGISLAGTALEMASGVGYLKDGNGMPMASDVWWIVALIYVRQYKSAPDDVRKRYHF
ncbi:solute carrier family 23 protein, partial [Candidatus Poribacteria bacterium]